MSNQAARWLAAGLVLAAIIVAGALIYTTSNTGGLPDDREALLNLIDERIAQGDGLSDEEFNRRVRSGILAFIQEQEQAQREAPNRLAQNVPPVTREDHVYGNPDAAISLIEYSEFECPFCKRFHPTAKTLVDQSDGKINWVMRHYPLPNHNPAAMQEARASECAAELAGNEAFWAYAEGLFERTRGGGRGVPAGDSGLVTLASKQGLDAGKFETCLQSGRHDRKIQRHVAEGSAAGVTGTPGNILRHRESGRVVAVHGAQPLPMLQQAVEQLSAAE